MIDKTDRGLPLLFVVLTLTLNSMWVSLIPPVMPNLVLLRLVSFGWARRCTVVASLCAEEFCAVSGNWHIAWQVAPNELYSPISALVVIPLGFPHYLVAVFVLPHSTTSGGSASST